MTKPTILLGGGYDKKSAYDEWIDAFHAVKCVILLLWVQRHRQLQTRQRITVSITSFLQILFEEAMDVAKEKARPGDAVLLFTGMCKLGHVQEL